MCDAGGGGGVLPVASGPLVGKGGIGGSPTGSGGLAALVVAAAEAMNF